MNFTFAFHYEVKCPDTPGGFIHNYLAIPDARPDIDHFNIS
jgi:hypothetical protein